MPLVSCEGEPAALIPEWNCGSTWTWARRTIGRSSVWRRPAAAWGSKTTLFLFFLFLFTIFLFLRWQLGCTFVTFLENLTCRENCRPVSKVFSFHCVYLLISFSTLFKKKKTTKKNCSYVKWRQMSSVPSLPKAKAIYYLALWRLLNYSSYTSLASECLHWNKHGLYSDLT